MATRTSTQRQRDERAHARVHVPSLSREVGVDVGSNGDLLTSEFSRAGQLITETSDRPAVVMGWGERGGVGGLMD